MNHYFRRFGRLEQPKTLHLYGIFNGGWQPSIFQMEKEMTSRAQEYAVPSNYVVLSSLRLYLN